MSKFKFVYELWLLICGWVFVILGWVMNNSSFTALGCVLTALFAISITKSIKDE